MTDASLLYICLIKQHKETLSEGGLMKFSIVLLVLVSGKFSCNSTCAGEGITRKSQNFFDHSVPGIHPHELASLRREIFFALF